MTIAYRNIARVVAPHGIKGEVTAEPLRGLPFLLHEGMTVALTPPALNRDRFCRVISTDAASGLTAFSGIDSLDAAEGIAGCYVLARADEVDVGPLVVAADDLIGRSVIDARYGELGRIVEIMETPANDVWVCDGGAYGEVLVPVIEPVLDAIPEAGAISVHVMDGIVDAPAPEADAGK